MGTSQFGLPPFLFLFRVGREEVEGGILFPLFSFILPLSFSTLASPYGGRTSPFPLLAHKAHNFCRVSGTPSGDPISTRCFPKHFWCPNTIVLYINIYLSNISRLLVISVISSGTSNNIRSPNHITHIIQNRHRTLSVRTLWVREQCRHDRDTSPINI